jgi:hypothetical protein
MQRSSLVDDQDEPLDLARVAVELAQTFAGSPPLGYLPGRTQMRDAVVRMLGCSQLRAEEIVDTMIARGMLTYEGSASGNVDDLMPWRIARLPERS